MTSHNIDKQSFLKYFTSKVSSIKSHYENNENINLDNDIYRESIGRLSLIKRQRIINPYGEVFNPVIPNYSSGEESGMADTSKPEVTLREACEYLIDPNTIHLVTRKEEIPKEARVYLLLRNLESWFNAYYLKYFIESLFKNFNYTCNLSEIRILNFEAKSALLYFSDLKEAEMLKSYFAHALKLNKNIINSRGELLECYWAYDATDIKNNNWYGIILRNIPMNSQVSKIKSYCANFLKSSNELDLDKLESHIKYVHVPIVIKSSSCSLLSIDTLENADKICIEFNKKSLNKTGSYIKAHLHPKTNKKRNKSTIMRLRFNNNSILYDKILPGHCYGDIIKSICDNRLNSSIIKEKVTETEHLIKQTSIIQTQIKPISTINNTSQIPNQTQLTELELIFANQSSQNNDAFSKMFNMSNSNEMVKKEEINKDDTKDTVKNIKDILQQLQANKQTSNSKLISVSEINQATVSNGNNVKLEKFNFNQLTNNDDIKYLNYNNIANFIVAYPKAIEIQPLIIRNLNEKINIKPKTQTQTLIRSQPVKKEETNRIKYSSIEETKDTLTTNFELLFKQTHNAIEKGEIVESKFLLETNIKEKDSKYKDYKEGYSKSYARSRSNSPRKYEYKRDSSKNKGSSKYEDRKDIRYDRGDDRYKDDIKRDYKRDEIRRDYKRDDSRREDSRRDYKKDDSRTDDKNESRRERGEYRNDNYYKKKDDRVYKGKYLLYNSI